VVFVIGELAMLGSFRFVHVFWHPCSRCMFSSMGHMLVSKYVLLTLLHLVLPEIDR
jgi:hypothetical protein